MSDPGHRRLAAVFFSDIVGYSRQMDADEAATLARLEVHDGILTREIARHGGRVIKTVGDAYMAEHPSAVQAVATALDVQRALALHNRQVPEPERIEVRIGVHAGDVVERAGDLFGETVNLAARLEGQAPPGGVCVSAAVYDQVCKRVEATAEDRGQVALKGIGAPVHVFALRPADEPIGEGKPSLPPRVRLAPRVQPARPRSILRAWPIALVVAVGVAIAAWKLRGRAAELAPHTVSSAASATASAPLAERPRRGDTLRVAAPFPIGTFDYFYSTPTLGSLALSLTTDLLFRRSTDGSVLPGAVDRWQALEQGRVVELHLRAGLRFNDHPCLPGGSGREATAEDLVYSLAVAATHRAVPAPMLEPALEPGNGPPKLRPAAVRAGGYVTVQLGQAVAQPEKMMLRIFLLPRELEGCEDLRHPSRPAGSGAFWFREDPGTDALRLERSSQAWERDGDEPLPWLDAVELRPLQDSVEALRLITAGQLDLFDGDDASHDPVVELEQGVVRLRSRFSAADVSVATDIRPSHSLVLSLLFLEPQRGAGSLELRRAIGLALDPDALLAGLRPEVRPLGRYLEPRLRGYDPAAPGVVKNQPEARRVLASAGHPAGRGLGELVLATGLVDWPIAERIRASLSELGLKVRIVERGRGAEPTGPEAKHPDALLTSIAIGLYGDELAFHRLISFFEQYGPVDEELTRLHNEFLAASDRDARATLAARLERQLLDSALAVPLGTFTPESAASFALFSPRVRGFADPITGRMLPAHGAPFLRVYLADAP